MDKDQQRKISKQLSYVLRHEPDSIGIQLDASGWVAIELLLKQLSKQKFDVSRSELELVVALNDKQRFSISEDGLLIRASQGHSVEVDLGYEPSQPPEFLYHGTVAKFIDQIFEHGLTKQDRHHVHLSESTTTANTVGKRRGKPILLKIKASEMEKQGIEFFVTPNRVWLVEHVPVSYIERI